MFRTWFFTGMLENGKSRNIWGPAEISAVARLPRILLNIHPGQKNRLFFEKVEFFLPPEGPDARNFCPETIVCMLLKNNKSCRFRQQMLFSASDEFLRDFWANLSRVLRVPPPFAYVAQEAKLKSSLKLDFRIVAQFWRELRPQSQIMTLILPIFEGKSVFQKVSLFGAGNAWARAQRILQKILWSPVTLSATFYT